MLRQGLPEREAVEGDAPEGAAAQQRGVDGSSFYAGPEAYKRRSPGQNLWSGDPKNGSYLLSHLVGQYQRRW